MNIRISIKDCDSQTHSRNHHLSEVDQKKKSMLYAPPEKDVNKQTKKKSQMKNHDNKNTMRQNPAYRESEKQMLEALNKNNIKQTQQQMSNQGNITLQRQNQIIQQNQRILNQALQKNEKDGKKQQQMARRQLKEGLDQIKRDVEQIKRARQDIMNAAKQFNRNVGEGKGRIQPDPRQMNDMNSNLKNLVEVSQNHLEGLENMEAIKALQNFNIEGYTSAINSIKRQIAQYQKQSQNIQRQLKIRSAKLEKLQISPNFQEELYKPYEDHITNRIKGIDLYSLRQRVYERLGVFDYGKFEYDVGNIMLEAKDELNNFPIICKEHRIQVPQVRFDLKELKKMDIKITSVLDQYKAARGIVFEEKKQNDQKAANQAQDKRGTIQNSNKKMSKTDQIQQKLKNNTESTNINRPYPRSKPIDMSKQTKLSKQYEKKGTILENDNKKQKKELENRMKKSSKEKRKEQDDFEKYLQNRAKEQLQLIYKQRRQNLKRMQEQLKEDCEEPVFITLDLDKKKTVRRQNNDNKQQGKKAKPVEQEQYDQEFEEESNMQKFEDSPKKRRNQQSQQKKALREVGKDVLKQKLKKMMIGKKKQQGNEQPRPNITRGNDNQQVQGMAEGFISMINHTLTQVNSNLANIIERKVQHSSQQRRTVSIQKREHKKIQIPKLQPFKAPPTFNMNLVQQPAPQFYSQALHAPVQEAPKKIVVQSYEQYMPKDYDNLQQLNISDDDSSQTE